MLILLAVLHKGSSITIDEIEEKVHIVHAQQGRQAKILMELLGFDEFENEKVDIVEPVSYDYEFNDDLEIENEDIFNKEKDEGKTRSLLGVFPFNNYTNSDHHHDHEHEHHPDHHGQEADHQHHHGHEADHQHHHGNETDHQEQQGQESDHHDHHEHEADHPDHHEADHHEHQDHVHESGDQHTALRTPLSNRTQDIFPFILGVKSNNAEVEDNTSFLSFNTSQLNSVGVSDGKGRKCVDKVNISELYIYV